MMTQPFLGPSQAPAADPNLISTTVTRKLNRRKGELNKLSRDEKLLCALRKALSSKSGADASYYIVDEGVYVTRRGGGVPARSGEAVSYTASGRFKMGAIQEEKVAFSMVEFNLTYRDTVDEHGMLDIEFSEPSTIKELPGRASLVP
jgi:hypothetical protein